MTTKITYRELLPSEVELLKTFVYEAIFVPEANYAVRMYKKVGFEIVDENDEEYIMVCEM